MKDLLIVLFLITLLFACPNESKEKTDYTKLQEYKEMTEALNQAVTIIESNISHINWSSVN